MSKKKFSDLSDLGGLVYSTGDRFPSGDDEEESTLSPEDQLLEVHLEKKGRGGKTAVIIRGFEGDDQSLKELAKEIKSHCACGGSVKDGEIILQGDLRNKVMDYLKNEGYRVKRVGGNG